MSGRWIWRGRPQALVRPGWGTSCGAPGSWNAQLLGSSWHHRIARAGWYRERPRWRMGGGGSRESGKVSTKPLQQAQSSGCSSEGGGGQGRGALGAWPQLSPPVIGKQRRLGAGTGPGRGTGLVPDPEGTVERRGRQACYTSHAHAGGRHHQSELHNRDYTGLSHQAQAGPQLLCTASTGHSRLIRVEASCDPVAGTGLERGVCVLRG